MTPGLWRSLLDGEHRALGARMVPFGGWEMPLRYGSVIEEHRACREDAAVFDVSHLGSVWVRGAGAFAGLQGLLSNDLSRIKPGRAQYTHLLDGADGHVVDDMIVWWVVEEEFLVVPNASNTGPALQALQRAAAAAPGGVVVEDVTHQRAFLAVQGPSALHHLGEIAPEAAVVPHLDVTRAAVPGGEALVGGTGYTGEPGVELFLPREAAGPTWRALLDVGVRPAGLGARDLLRLEMGYPLHGHELGPGVTPLQAGLGWVVGWDKPAFQGRDALLAERQRGPARRLAGVVLADRRVPREGCPVLIGGRRAGEVTSGNLSPVLGRGIALAFLPPGTAPGTDVEVEIRGRRADGRVTRPPFLQAERG
ncbi:MAG: glycine cleavage system aminomethyltransferase GcvT [Egibacteraceae bacterium]